MNTKEGSENVQQKGVSRSNSKISDSKIEGALVRIGASTAGCTTVGGVIGTLFGPAGSTIGATIGGVIGFVASTTDAVTSRGD